MIVAPSTTLTVRTVAVEDPHDLLAHLAGPSPLAWVRQGEGLVGWGCAAQVTVGAGLDRFAAAASELAALLAGADVEDGVGVPGTGPVGFGSFAFDPTSADSSLVVPSVVLGRRDGRAWLTTVGDVDPGTGRMQALVAPARVRYAGASLPEVRWLEAVDVAARDVRSGRLDKVVLARDLRVWSSEALDVRVLARRLAERFPDCFTFVCDGLVGATPELLIRRTGAAVTSLVLAGSAPRGASGDEDERLGSALLDSPKDRAEHLPAVASVADVLGLRCDDVRVDATPWLLRLSNLQHLATTVEGRLAAPATALELAGALHPTAAVCGTPTDVAMARIRELEGMDRGRYAGPVGWVDARGDGEFGIALRCARVDGSHGTLYAGAGIVADSLPEGELEETRLKLRAMQSALEG